MMQIQINNFSSILFWLKIEILNKFRRLSKLGRFYQLVIFAIIGIILMMLSVKITYHMVEDGKRDYDDTVKKIKTLEAPENVEKILLAKNQFLQSHPEIVYILEKNQMGNMLSDTESTLRKK